MEVGDLVSRDQGAEGAGGLVDTRTLPPVNAGVAARCTPPGIVAHASARQGGVRLGIPDLGDAPEA